MTENKIERNVTAALVIREMCKEFLMTEEQLLVHLAIENIDSLSRRGQKQVAIIAAEYHKQGIFQVSKVEI